MSRYPSIPTTLSFPDSKSEQTLSRKSNSKTKVLVFFITGNPGLINYYHTFLSHLYGLLSTSEPSSSTVYEVYGRSLRGFEVDGDDAEIDGPWGLEQQIESVREDVMKQSDALRRESNSGDVKVVLMGHSVGAYILLEVLRRLKGTDYSTRIVGGVCLFPTVTWIAKSQSGKKFALPYSLPLLRQLPFFRYSTSNLRSTSGTPGSFIDTNQWLLAPSRSALIASFLAKLLTFFIPFSILVTLVRYVLSFPPEAALTTATFIKSKTGIRQALHMARDEMTAITHDAWSDEIWGTAAKAPGTKLVFLFGTNDHWVANETRDELILSRGRTAEGEGWKPRMEIDKKEGWPHEFCIKYSLPVARKLAGHIGAFINHT